MSTTSAPPLDPSPRILLGPGPSEVHPRVTAAMTLPVHGHLDPEFLRVMDEIQVLLRQVFRTRNPLTLAVPGTGSAGMEAVITNLVEPGDRVLICVKGFFGARMAEVARRAGGEVTVIERVYGEAFEPEEVKAAVARTRPKLVGIVHAETSTGVLQPLEEIARVVHEAGALIAIDTVTSLGAVPVEIDAWDIDAAYSCTQKGLSCPPGLAPVTFGRRAVEVIRKRKTKVQSWYLDMTLLEKYWGPERLYHHTAPISMNYALSEALAIVLEEGLEARFERHRSHHQVLKAGLGRLGVRYVPADQYQLPQLNCVWIPEGVDDLTVRKRLLSDWGLEIGGGLGPLKGKVWRIGIMGQSCRMAYVTLLLAALESCLGALRQASPTKSALASPVHA